MVTFAAKTSGTGTTPVLGAGNGYIDVFSTSGQRISRYASRGPLNTPYGLIISSSGILVANHGDGRVLKYETTERFSCDTGCTIFTGEYQTPILTVCDAPLENDGIWGLARGSTCKSKTDDIYFTAGSNLGVNGLVGVFIPIEETNNRRIVSPIRKEEVVTVTTGFLKGVTFRPYR
jgi:hypothetical protein